MSLEIQICALQYAKQFKELGIKQRSLWYWIKNKDGEYDLWSYKRLTVPKKYTGYSAFTVAELGEIIRKKFGGRCLETVWYEKNRFSSEVKIGKHDKNFKCLMNSYMSYILKDLPITEANSRAKLLIYLLENKLIKM